jgi:hypothetical protein
MAGSATLALTDGGCGFSAESSTVWFSSTIAVMLDGLGSHGNTPESARARLTDGQIE